MCTWDGLQGDMLEREWKEFFLGSVRAQDKLPKTLQGKELIGLEEGVDLFLGPMDREILVPGLVQVKSCPAQAILHLQHGFSGRRREIIPVVVGTPPKDPRKRKEVLWSLAQDYCWHPQWKEAGEYADQLNKLIRALVDLSPPLRERRPRWAMDLT